MLSGHFFIFHAFLYLHELYDQIIRYIIRQKLLVRMKRSSTSPFRTVSGTLNRPAGSESTQILIRSLEQQNNSLVEEIGALRARVNKTNELEDKIQLILKHNTQLLNENERLAKLINQKKSQIDIWKNKHDSALANRSTATDLEVKRLLNEIEKLKEQACEIQHAKNHQINQMKNQQHLQIQNLKRANLGSVEKYELEIRKYKEIFDKKDYELSDLKMKFARMGKQSDFEIGKLREEKQRLRNDLQFEQAEHRKELQSLKSKFDYNFHSQIENLKKQHFNQIETLDYENSKLKEVINSKNLQLEQSIAKQSKMRNHYEDSIELLKKQNNELKQKLVQNEQIANLQLNNLREKLESIKQSEVALLKAAHNNQIDILEREISKLHKFLTSRNDEIENMNNQKNQIRQSLEAEIQKIQAELEKKINQNTELKSQHEINLKVCDDDYKYKNQEMKTMEIYLKSQVQSYKKEKEAADELLANRQRQLTAQRKQSNEIIRIHQQEIRSLKQNLNQAKDELERVANRSANDSQDAKKLHELKVREFQTRIANLEQQIFHKDSLIKELKQNIELLAREIKINDEKIQYLENGEKELRSQAKENFARWDAKEKELNRLIRQQISSLQRTKHIEVEELKSIHQNKTQTLKHQIKELQKQVEDKNRGINSLKAKYEQLSNGFEKVFSQEAARKNLDIKVPGWLPQTLALKSQFDVFLKNKVLEYCS